jgi:hypothetical protein
MVERGGEREGARAGDAVIAGFEPDAAAIGRRGADRAAGIGPERGRTRPPATAEAEPEEEPPVIWAIFHGLRAGGSGRPKSGPTMANS